MNNMRHQATDFRPQTSGLGLRTLDFLYPILISVSILVSIISPVYAQIAGEISLAIATPDPVSAGEKVTFQTVLLNRGEWDWKPGEYFVEVEIYSFEKKYLQKTDRKTGDTVIKPMESGIIYVPVRVPNNYTGMYYYRVSLLYKNQRIGYTEYTPMNVMQNVVASKQTKTMQSVSTKQKQPSQINMGGNVIISYRNGSRNNWYDYVGSLSLNSLARVYDRAISLNMYANNSPAQSFDLYNFILNYYGKNLSFSLGDVMPDFNSLSLLSYGVRGIYATENLSWFTMSVVTVQTAKAVEGTETRKGTYERYLTGVQTKIEPVSGFSFGASYVSSFDTEQLKKLSEPGPGAQKVRDNVTAGFMSWDWGVMSFMNEYAQSYYVEGSTNTVDLAYKTKLSFTWPVFSVSGSFQETKPNFISLGSPSIINDRQTIELLTKYEIPNWFRLSAGFTQYIDNLKLDPEKAGTVQQIVNPTLSFVRSKWPGLIVSYSKNKINERITDAVNNFTETISTTLMYNISWLNFLISGQQSSFVNSKNTDNNSVTQTAGLNLGTNISDVVTINLGNVYSNTLYIDQTTNKTLSTSLTTKIKIIPEKLVVSVWGNYLQRISNNLFTTANSDTTNVNGEITYYMFRNLYLTLGGGNNKVVDKYRPEQSLNEVVVNSKLGMTF